MLFKFAFRNVLRNKRRSFLTALAIFFAALLVGLAQGFINGMIDTYMSDYIDYQTGNVRITTEEFLDRERFMPVDELIPESDGLKQKLEKLDLAESVEERIRFGILLGHQETTVQALGMGVDLEHNSFEIKDKLVAGSLGATGLYIGDGLAKKLKVQLGDKLLLATKTSEGGLNGIKLRVAGIVHLGIGMLDKKVFFLSLQDAKRLLKIYDSTTEIYIFTEKEKQTEALATQVKSNLPEGLVAQTYMEQLGSFYSYMELAKFIYLFIESLILFLASFIVINTMMMAIFERMHEIGTLKALGMSDHELFVNFTLEGALIGAAGGIPGALLGYLFIIILHYTGMNFQTSMASIDMPIEYIIYPTLSVFALVSAVLLSILVPAVAALGPARYARKLQPAEALRK